MPCEVIPCIVNNTTCIFVEPRANKLGTNTMHETKAKVEQENNLVWTETDLRGRGSKETSGSSYGRALLPEGNSNMLQNNLTFHDIRQRILSTSLGDFGTVIEDCEQTSNGHVESNIWFSRSKIPNCEPPRRYSTSSWPSETFMREYQRSRELSAPKANRRRQSEGFIFSRNKVFGLVGYRNESMGVLEEQRSENYDHNTKVIKRERDSSRHKTSHNISLASFDIMSSVATTAFDQPNSYYSLPRRLSHPVKSLGNDYETTNGKEQRNSLPTEDCLQQYHFDSDTELQWQRLVARAKTLQLSSPKTPEIICSRLTDNNNDQVSQKATKSPGDTDRGADNLNSGKERKIYEVKPLDKENNNSSQPVVLRRRPRRTEERRYSLKMVPTGLERLSESQTSDDKMKEKKMVHPRSGNPKTLVSEQRLNPLENTNRRHSVAVVRPVQQVNERVSGYSTHGALEYAKMLMEKIQEAGKTKSKKERLDEMSKVLKLVLEELNRIETPDRDLVSLFISLRAKMVNLRTELKVDERQKEMVTGKQTEEKKLLSKSLPRPGSTEEQMPVQPRRFSWI